MLESYLIAVDSREMVIFGSRSGRVVATGRQAISEQTLTGLAAALHALLDIASARPGAATVWLGTAWARLLLVDWPDVRLDREERVALLRHCWADVLPDPDWALLVADTGTPRLSVAMRSGLADMLASGLVERRIRPRSLLPALCGALEAADIADGGVLLDEGDRVVSASCTSGRVVSLAIARRPAGVSSAAEAATPDATPGALNDGKPRQLTGPGGALAWGDLWH
jgi:hypothetical protein